MPCRCCSRADLLYLMPYLTRRRRPADQAVIPVASSAVSSYSNLAGRPGPDCRTDQLQVPTRHQPSEPSSIDRSACQLLICLVISSVSIPSRPSIIQTTITIRPTPSSAVTDRPTVRTIPTDRTGAVRICICAAAVYLLLLLYAIYSCINLLIFIADIAVMQFECCFICCIWFIYCCIFIQPYV